MPFAIFGLYFAFLACLAFCIKRTLPGLATTAPFCALLWYSGLVILCISCGACADTVLWCWYQPVYDAFLLLAGSVRPEYDVTVDLYAWPRLQLQQDSLASQTAVLTQAVISQPLGSSMYCPFTTHA